MEKKCYTYACKTNCSCKKLKATKYQCVVYQQIEQKKKNGFCQLSNKSQLKSQRGSVGSAS